MIQRARELPELPDVPMRRMRSRIVAMRGQQVNEGGFFYTPRISTRDMVDRLFGFFLGMGLGYDIGLGGPQSVLGNYAEAIGLRPGANMRDYFGGNCIGLARAFAIVLDEADIPAEAVEVRRQRAGKAFVVNCPNFIDDQVRGHIYRSDAVWDRHYLFMNHTAVWVPALRRYYDPMAGTTYNNLSEKIVMELDSVGGSENVWTGWYQGRRYTLTRRMDVAPGPGQFSRYDMEAVPITPPPPPPAPPPPGSGLMATPLGNFKPSDRA